MSRKTAFLLGIVPLWLMFFVGFIVWWDLMSMLFRRGSYSMAIVVAFAMPTVHTLAAWLGSRIQGRLIKLPHFISFIGVTAIFWLINTLLGGGISMDPGAWLGISFISAVMAIMQYPAAGLKSYRVYRPPLFLGGVIFMPLFVYFAAMLPNVPHTPAVDKVWLFPVGMAGFWLSGAWLAARGAQGSYVSGLTIRPLTQFRPDFILGGGVTFVKGLIMMGVGLMIAIMPMLGMPRWNWWGFVLAFWGIITLIPLRGMYKMLRGKRARMLGVGGADFRHEVYTGLILFFGLNILLYGFVNAFSGTIPFLELGVKREFNSFLSGNVAGAVIAAATFVASFIVLVLLRGWYKLELLEGAETTWQSFNKQLLLYIGAMLLVVSYIHFLNLPAIRDPGYMGFHPSANPLGFWVGTGLFLAGSALMLIFRPIALKNEFNAVIANMIGVISDSGERVRRWVMENRINVLTAMPTSQRDRHVKLMMMGLNSLPQEKRELMMKTQIDILSSLDSESRRRMMASMDKATLGAA